MKKMLILGLVTAVVMMFSVGILAEENGDPDWTPMYNTETADWYENFDVATNLLPATQVLDLRGNPEYVTVEGTHTAEKIEPSVGDQEIKVTIATAAMVPCYLEMELVGNGGYTKAKSIGKDAVVDFVKPSNNHIMLFQPEYGGILDADWNMLNIEQDILQEGLEGYFSTLGAKSNVYINACDMWTANLFANVPYDFEVSATPLTQDQYSFNMDMRYASETVVDISTMGVVDFSNPVEVSGLGTANIGSFGALDNTSVLMQFRVPFSDQVPAGEYNGDVTFTMTSL